MGVGCPVLQISRDTGQCYQKSQLGQMQQYRNSDNRRAKKWQACPWPHLAITWSLSPAQGSPSPTCNLVRCAPAACQPGLVLLMVKFSPRLRGFVTNVAGINLSQSLSAPVCTCFHARTKPAETISCPSEAAKQDEFKNMGVMPRSCLCPTCKPALSQGSSGKTTL